MENTDKIVSEVAGLLEKMGEGGKEAFMFALDAYTRAARVEGFAELLPCFFGFCLSLILFKAARKLYEKFKETQDDDFVGQFFTAAAIGVLILIFVCMGTRSALTKIIVPEKAAIKGLITDLKP